MIAHLKSVKPLAFNPAENDVDDELARRRPSRNRAAEKRAWANFAFEDAGGFLKCLSL